MASRGSRGCVMSVEIHVQLVGDPGPFWLTLGMPGPTAIDEGSGALIVFRHDEIDALAHDRRMVGVGLSWFDMMAIDGDLRDWYASLMFTNEGPVHDRLRRLVSKAFTPRAVERLRQHARDRVEEILGQLDADGGGDLVPAFRLLAMHVMCRLLGVPAEDIPVFAGWADALSPVFGLMDPVQIRAAEEALAGLTAYVEHLVADRVGSPADDLITTLLAAEDDGDRLHRHEVVTMVTNLLVGGHDTTTSQLCCSLSTLLRHPYALARLASGAVPVTAAVSETMRVEPSIPLIPRTASAPIEIGGRLRDAGTMVALSVASGNRDPAVWSAPDVFDVDRFVAPDAPRLLSFGSGTHYCLGANLARMTLEETVRGVAEHPVTLAGDPVALEWKQVLGRSPAALPVTRT